MSAQTPIGPTLDAELERLRGIESRALRKLAAYDERTDAGTARSSIRGQRLLLQYILWGPERPEQ